jgi:hypothetical protein
MMRTRACLLLLLCSSFACPARGALEVIAEWIPDSAQAVAAAIDARGLEVVAGQAAGAVYSAAGLENAGASVAIGVRLEGTAVLLGTGVGATPATTPATPLGPAATCEGDPWGLQGLVGALSAAGATGAFAAHAGYSQARAVSTLFNSKAEQPRSARLQMRGIDGGAAYLTSPSWSVARSPASWVRAMVKTPALYRDLCRAEVVYQARDARGRARVSGAGVSVRLKLGSGADAAYWACTAPGSDSGAGLCAISSCGSSLLGWFSGAGDVTVSAVVQVLYSSVVKAESSAASLTLSKVPEYAALSGAGMVVEIPAAGMPRGSAGSGSRWGCGRTRGATRWTGGASAWRSTRACCRTWRGRWRWGPRSTPRRW